MAALVEMKPPTSPMRINFSSTSSIKVDAANGRYFAVANNGVVLRSTWGGKAAGYPRLGESWMECCMWCLQAPYSEEMVTLIQEATLAVPFRPRSDSLIIPRSVALDEMDRSTEELCLRQECVFEDVVYDCYKHDDDKALPALPDLPGVLVPTTYRKLRNRLVEDCTFTTKDGDTECWIKEVIVRDPNPEHQPMIGVFCSLCSQEIWKDFARHTSNFARSPKTSNHIWFSYSNHSKSDLHVRILKTIGALRVPGGLEDHGEIVAGPSPAPPLPDSLSALFNCARIYIATIRSGGTVADFGQKLTEHAVITPGSVGKIFGGQSFKTFASKCRMSIEDVMDADLQLDVNNVIEYCCNADEPRGVHRCGEKWGSMGICEN